MTWVMSGFCGWAVALCVDTWKLPGTWGEMRVPGVWWGAGLHPAVGPIRIWIPAWAPAAGLWSSHCPSLSPELFTCSTGRRQ